MEKINIPNTPKTPSIKFDSEQGKLEIKGRSIPENSVEFYKPIIEALEIYGRSPKPITQIDIQLEYFNTASSKCLWDMFKILETINSEGTRVNINWYYDDGDDDMIESGEDYQTKVSLPFSFIKS